MKLVYKMLFLVCKIATFLPKQLIQLMRQCYMTDLLMIHTMDAGQPLPLTCHFELIAKVREQSSAGQYFHPFVFPTLM